LYLVSHGTDVPVLSGRRVILPYSVA